MSENIADTPSTKSAEPHPPEDEKQIPAADFGEFVHSYIREYIQLADQKAALSLAVCTAMIGYLDSNGYATDLFAVFSANWVLGVIQFTALFSLILGIASSVFVVLPRLSSKSDGLVFFESVSKIKDARRYSERVLASSQQCLLVEILEHAHALSRVCNRKYNSLKIALYSSSSGLVFSLLVILIRK